MTQWSFWFCDKSEYNLREKACCISMKKLWHMPRDKYNETNKKQYWTVWSKDIPVLQRYCDALIQKADIRRCPTNALVRPFYKDVFSTSSKQNT